LITDKGKTWPQGPGQMVFGIWLPPSSDLGQIGELVHPK